ncbi:MAG: FtsW/RodA/SpoVE family cell cycle protein, partial [Elusimicrobiaceae bacterium]
MIISPGGKGLKKGRIDWLLAGAAGLTLLMGTMAILSAVSGLPFADRVVRIHFTAVPIAVTLFFLAWSLNYQIYQDQWKKLYGFILLLLVAVLVIGTADRGSKSWFRLPFFSLQPSEICRVGLILVLANYLDKNSGRIKQLGTLLGAVALVSPVFVLIMLQPDFSALLVTFPTIVAMLYCGGASVAHLLTIMGYGAIVGGLTVLWTMIPLNPQWL